MCKLGTNDNQIYTLFPSLFFMMCLETPSLCLVTNCNFGGFFGCFCFSVMRRVSAVIPMLRSVPQIDESDIVGIKKKPSYFQTGFESWGTTCVLNGHKDLQREGI